MSTKLHLRTDVGGQPLVLLVTPGQRHEVTQLQRLLDGGALKRTGPDGRPGRGRPRKRPAKLAGDKGYAYSSARRLLRRRGITPVIPTKSDQPRQPPASTGPPTGAATAWSAALGGSSSSAVRPPVTTSARSTTWPGSPSPPP